VNARARHLDAICAAVERRLAAAPQATARRLLRPQLRWVAQQLDGGGGEELGRRLGVVELVESCRDEHLARLDADDGLTVLQIDWTEVVERVSERMLSDGTVRRCARCGARLPARRALRCSRCGLAPSR
jgi:ribosomal protein L40E